jgi:hypothetical protein
MADFSNMNGLVEQVVVVGQLAEVPAVAQSNQRRQDGGKGGCQHVGPP